MKVPNEPLISQDLPADHRSGFVALLGKPNVGKSTLLNAWMGIKIAAVSAKPQTTRQRLLGILTRPDAQIIFVDTPGIHEPYSKLGELMVDVARAAAPDADIVLLMVDLAQPPDAADRQAASVATSVNGIETILVMNKLDLVSGETLAERRRAYEGLGAFDEAVCISALNGAGVDELLDMVIEKLPQGPRFYPEDQLTDRSERFVAAEMIREQILQHLYQEVPHAIAVVVESFKRRDNGVLYIEANIYVERDSQKGIVIGRGGSMLKKIGRTARQELEAFFDCPVYVDLWVKVRQDWRKKDDDLRDLGFRNY